MPGFNPRDPKSVGRLRKSITYARLKMEPFRDVRDQSIREMTGPNYGSSSDTLDKTPVNMMEMMVGVLTRSIAANNPQVMVSSFERDLFIQAGVFEDRINKTVKEMRLVNSLRSALKESIVSPMGVVRLGISPDYEVEIDGEFHDVGQPFADPVTLDNFVLDMHADSIEQADFVGHRYTRPLEYLQSSSLYDQSVVKTISASVLRGIGPDGKPRDRSLGQGSEGYTQPLYDYVELWDIYLPAENIIVTMTDSSMDDVLRVVTHDGPEGSPYRYLMYDEVPGQIMPLAPSALMLDLHDFVNRVYRKIFRQAERQKEVPIYQGGAEDDSRRVVDAGDGEMTRVDDINAISRIKFGGADPQSIAIAIHARQLFSRMGGNLETLGGLAPQADTASQENLLNENASKKVQYMQKRFLAFTKEIVEAIAWYEWTDPIREEVVARQISGTDYFVDELWSPETREGDFVQYDIDIQPFSMQHTSPGSQLKLLMQVWQNVVIPGVQLDPSVTPKLTGMLEAIAELGNLPQVRQIAEYSDASQATKPQDEDSSDRIPQPSRQFQFGGTPRSRQPAGGVDEDQKLMQQMLSGVGSPAGASE